GGDKVDIDSRQIARGSAQLLQIRGRRNQRPELEIAAQKQISAGAPDQRGSRILEEARQQLEPAPDQRLLKRELHHLARFLLNAFGFAFLGAEHLQQESAGNGKRLGKKPDKLGHLLLSSTLELFPALSGSPRGKRDERQKDKRDQA